MSLTAPARLALAGKLLLTPRTATAPPIVHLSPRERGLYAEAGALATAREASELFKLEWASG